jgi:MarR family transcriptional regulator, organic hydroperoxide resistance regulator
MADSKLTHHVPAHQTLDQQLCFPLYAASRLVTRLYQPLLEQYNLTYTQYIVLMILWQHDGASVKQIGEKALLNSNTLTPLLKRMQQAQLLERKRSNADERQVEIKLTAKGWQLKVQLACIPKQLITTADFDSGKTKQLKILLEQLLEQLK